MAISRLSCPDCGTVLRPAKPVAPGKKVKCPKCELVFVALDDEDEEDDAPRRKPAKSKKGSVKSKSAPKEEEEELYGLAREPDDEDEDDKPRIDYAPDESIRDLRGPAIVKLTPPANKLQLIGMACVLGWMILFVLLLIPTVFPIQAGGAGEKAAPVMRLGPGLGAVDPNAGGGFGGFGGFGGGGGAVVEKKFEEEKGGFFEFFGFDLSVWFLYLMVPMILGGVYSAMVVAGGINAQNLESRAWAMTGSILAMLPINTLGVMVVTTLIVGYLANAVLEDAAFGEYVSMGLMAVQYLISLGVGIWTMKTLFDEEVVDGFEFDPD
jgi:uncharacterized Zn finger protein (UPF0148 family)